MEQLRYEVLSSLGGFKFKPGDVIHLWFNPKGNEDGYNCYIGYNEENWGFFREATVNINSFNITVTYEDRATTAELVLVPTNKPMSQDAYPDNPVEQAREDYLNKVEEINERLKTIRDEYSKGWKSSV